MRLDYKKSNNRYMKELKDFTLEELREEFARRGIPSFRAGQVFHWQYRQGVYSFEEMRNLPVNLVKELKGKYSLCAFKNDKRLVSSDGTHKFLLTLKDTEKIETVVIPAYKRGTACLSTQVGCKFGCTLCASGLKKFVRNLSTAEIVDQLVYVQSKTGDEISHVVFMGMGEPLDNYENVTKAIRIINHEDGLCLAARKITISTAGIVPGIKILSDFELQVNLSLSLHATTDEKRSMIMPINKKYPLESVLGICEEYFKKTKRIITLEYALLKGVNDSQDDVQRLAEITRRLKAKVNLLTFNPYPELKCEPVSSAKMKYFQELLKSLRVPVTIRNSRGADISAACGQLAARDSDEI